MSTRIDIPELRIERYQGSDAPLEGPDCLWQLEQQSGYDDPDRVLVHPVHVRLLAELVGLAPASDLEAHRTIARLCRYVRKLAERIEETDRMLMLVQNAGHEDVAEELAHSGATLELAREFCIELPDGGNPPNFGGVQRANPPNSGGIDVAGQIVPDSEGGAK